MAAFKQILTFPPISLPCGWTVKVHSFTHYDLNMNDFMVRLTNSSEDLEYVSAFGVKKEEAMRPAQETLLLIQERYQSALDDVLRWAKLSR